MSVFGRIVTRFDIEAAVVENVVLWLPDYVSETARQHGIDPGKIVMPHQPYQTRSRFGAFTSGDLPMLTVTSAGLAGQPSRHGDGSYAAPWAIGVAGVVEASGDTAREIAGIHGAAVRELMINHPEQGGIGQDGEPGIATATYWVDEKYDDLRPGEEGNRASYIEMFVVVVDGVVSGAGGPAEPSNDPTEEPGDNPVATAIAIDVQRGG